MSKRKQIIKKSQMVAIQDTVTGEMDTAKVTVIVARDTPKYKNEPFTILFQASTWIIGSNATDFACKVLITICSCVDYGNKVSKTQQEIANHLGRSKRSIQRAYGELEKADILHKQKNPTDSRITDWFINANQSWKGSVPDRKKRLAITDPNQLGMFLKEKTNNQLSIPVASTNLEEIKDFF